MKLRSLSLSLALLLATGVAADAHAQKSARKPAAEPQKETHKKTFTLDSDVSSLLSVRRVTVMRGNKSDELAIPQVSR